MYVCVCVCVRVASRVTGGFKCEGLGGERCFGGNFLSSALAAVWIGNGRERARAARASLPGGHVNEVAW